MKYTFVIQLIELAGQFEEEYGTESEPGMEHFVAWLNQRILKRKPGEERPAGQRMHPYETADSQLGKLITYLYRYTRTYAKKSLENTPLVTADDFTYLAGLFGRGSLTKTELIEMHVHEKTTGIEIIKRLLKNGLVEQRNDETDKRSKRLDLTPAGRDLLFQVFPRMGQMAALVGGNLSAEERMQLLYLLNKLHQFHNDIYHSSRDMPPEQILAEKRVFAPAASGISENSG
jgi:MarR family transcriptional regulator, lower aerobic nicotinate degradation pathway regulator